MSDAVRTSPNKDPDIQQRRADLAILRANGHTVRECADILDTTMRTIYRDLNAIDPPKCPTCGRRLPCTEGADA